MNERDQPLLIGEGSTEINVSVPIIAEQNSVELAWNLLMKKEYESLRSCIYQTEEELRRFRQLLANTVMATDIADKEQLLKARWEGAFSSESAGRAKDDVENEDRKATIVIEDLSQASAVIPCNIGTYTKVVTKSSFVSATRMVAQRQIQVSTGTRVRLVL